MKTISPITVWSGGSSQTATLFSMVIASDDMSTKAAFRYDLQTAQGVSLINGLIEMSGSNYLAWNGSNDAGYTWVATQLNLTITGNA